MSFRQGFPAGCFQTGTIFRAGAPPLTDVKQRGNSTAVTVCPTWLNRQVFPPRSPTEPDGLIDLFFRTHVLVGSTTMSWPHLVLEVFLKIPSLMRFHARSYPLRQGPGPLRNIWWLPSQHWENDVPPSFLPYQSTRKVPSPAPLSRFQETLSGG